MKKQIVGGERTTKVNSSGKLERSIFEGDVVGNVFGM